MHDPIAEAKSAEPTMAELRAAVTTSPLLAQLPEGDIDRLAQGSRRQRYRVDELVFDSNSESRELLLILEGRGRLVLLEPGLDEAVVVDVGVGEVVGLLDAGRLHDQVVAMRATTDCEVLAIPAKLVGEVGSRNADVVAAIDRLVAQRQRRIRRLVDSRTPSISPPTSDAGPS